MGREAFQRSLQDRDRTASINNTKRKIFLSDLSKIFLVLAFVLFVIGYWVVVAPVPAATVLWICALASLFVSAVIGAVNHFC